jgi:hypothetical protein
LVGLFDPASNGGLASFRVLAIGFIAESLTELIGALWQGWLDITYLSPDGQFRLSRGNKARPSFIFILLSERQPLPLRSNLQSMCQQAPETFVAE